jgi:predicted DsbA family dithiol-disulfide isomerase
VRWRAFPLNPDIPPEGVPLDRYAAERLMDVGAMQRRLKQAALEAGLPYNGIHTIYNTQLAQELNAWAYTVHAGNAFHELVFAANFVDGKNISDPKVLETIAVFTGLDGKTTANVMKKRSFVEVVDRDWAVARERNISVAPTLMLGQDRLVGVRPYDAMARFLEKHGVKKRASVA